MMSHENRQASASWESLSRADAASLIKRSGLTEGRLQAAADLVYEWEADDEYDIRILVVRIALVLGMASEHERQASDAAQRERIEAVATVLLDDVPEWEGCPPLSIYEARTIAEVSAVLDPPVQGRGDRRE